jgi:GTP diphosphokinase / guanosine-3',5'-bis(diphosphate) 3'-diphosphatase
MATLNDLMGALSRSKRKVNKVKIRRAWEFANLAHTGQKRNTGEPYIEHATATAITLADWWLDTDAIVAALLHDSVDDGGATREDLAQEFGEPVARLVDGVSHIGKIRLKGNTEEEFVENLRKMILVMAKDLRVVLVKLADRLHNMQTIEGLLPVKRKQFAKETLEIYAPLAERLGIGYLKGELEDLAFPYIYPREFKWVNDYSQLYYRNTKQVIQTIRAEVKKMLLANEMEDGFVQARSKRKYSLFKKLMRPEHNKDISKIHDLVALRIVVGSVEDCYQVLGMIHRMYRPVTHLGIRDFIANPKPNGYQSIHTNVFGPGGKIVEMQIRTHEMHEAAEYGIAAHWHYTEAKSNGVDDEALERGVLIPEEKLQWVKQLVEWQGEIRDNQEYFEALKFDALQHRQLVFSPKGDVLTCRREQHRLIMPLPCTPI